MKPTSEPILHSNRTLCSDGGSSEPTLHSDVRRRRNGKVASLPRPHRDLVNQMLEDGVAYNKIVAAVAQLGHTVSARNISNWYQGGHQDWLLHQERLDSNRISEEAVLDALDGDRALDLPAVGLQIAATHLCQLLLARRPENADPESGLNHYIRVANSLCRISRQLIQLQQLRDEAASDSEDDETSDEEQPRPSVESLLKTFSPLSPAQPGDHAADSSSKVQSSMFNVQASGNHPAPLSPLHPLPSILSLTASEFQGSAIQTSNPKNPPIPHPPSSNPLIHQSIRRR